jgi:hypothetical protein
MVRGRGARPTTDANLNNGAGANLSDPARQRVTPLKGVPVRGDGPNPTATHRAGAVATPSAPAEGYVTPIELAQARGDGQSTPDDQSSAAVATIVDLWRLRQRLRRSVGGLSLSALAVCRRACDGDKEAAQKAWAEIQKGRGDPALALVVEPYREMMAVGERHAKGLEKELCRRVRPLPLWAWAKDVRGLAELSVAGLIGEASGNPGDYRSVSALWKRFGLAVIDGERQRRVADAQAALIHGYAPERRAFAYVLSTQLMRSQRDGDPYRALYDVRKAYELARDIPKAHAHNRALRVMVKALLRDVWAADRRGRLG